MSATLPRIQHRRGPPSPWSFDSFLQAPTPLTATMPFPSQETCAEKNRGVYRVHQDRFPGPNIIESTCDVPVSQKAPAEPPSLPNPSRTPATLESTWKQKCSSMAGGTAEMALRELRGEVGYAKGGEADADPSSALILDPDHIHGGRVLPGTYRIAEMPKPDRFLMNPTERRMAHKVEVETLHAQTALAKARRQYNRLNFIAKSRYPNGFLMGESPHSEGTEVYSSTKKLMEHEASLTLTGSQSRMERLLGTTRKNENILEHSPTRPPQERVAQRKRQVPAPPDTFVLEKMMDPLPKKATSDIRKNNLVYADSRGRGYDCITGAALLQEPANPYAS
eukprot:Sspe_Gene.115490::Locus_103031_Transcript_1_1_Confidence_1.000_Length_1180::g.115490::m.115490